MKADWYRFLYRTFRAWSSFHFKMFHAFNWASYKAYDKAKMGKHGRARDGVFTILARKIGKLIRRS